MEDGWGVWRVPEVRARFQHHSRASRGFGAAFGFNVVGSTLDAFLPVFIGFLWYPDDTVPPASSASLVFGSRLL